jgi:hypothetical protein
MPITETTKVILKSNKSWDLWFYIKASKADRIWKYYDLYIKREDFPKLVEPVKPIYSNIKIIISIVIPIIVSSNSLIETPVQGDNIIYPIVYSNLSINKKTKY